MGFLGTFYENYILSQYISCDTSDTLPSPHPSPPPPLLYINRRRHLCSLPFGRLLFGAEVRLLGSSANRGGMVRGCGFDLLCNCTKQFHFANEPETQCNERFFFFFVAGRWWMVMVLFAEMTDLKLGIYDNSFVWQVKLQCFFRHSLPGYDLLGYPVHRMPERYSCTGTQGGMCMDQKMHWWRS